VARCETEINLGGDLSHRAATRGRRFRRGSQVAGKRATTARARRVDLAPDPQCASLGRAHELGSAYAVAQLREHSSGGSRNGPNTPRPKRAAHRRAPTRRQEHARRQRAGSTCAQRRRSCVEHQHRSERLEPVGVMWKLCTTQGIERRGAVRSACSGSSRSATGRCSSLAATTGDADRSKLRREVRRRSKPSTGACASRATSGFVRISANSVRWQDTPDTRHRDSRGMRRRDACSRPPPS
jgi:hypothetical protein